MLDGESDAPHQRKAEPRLQRAIPVKRLLRFASVLAVVLISVEVSSYLLIWLSGPFLTEEIRSVSNIYAEQSEYIRTMLAEDGSGRNLFDARLGWRYRPGYRNGDDAINGQGLRGYHSYAETAPPGIVRIAAFGDSFVYGQEVDMRDSWPALLEEAGREFEALNYGVGGYGTDQALLRYRAEGTALHPDLVLIGFAPICLRRNVNVYLRFIHNRNSVATKPRFLMRADGGLTSLENPVSELSEWRTYLNAPELVRRFGAHDHWYRSSVYESPVYDRLAIVRLLTLLWIRLDDRYFRGNRLESGDLFNEESDAFVLSVAILRTFAEEVSSNGAEAMVLILPDRRSVIRDRAGQARSFDPLVAALQHAKIDVLDATRAFREDERAQISSWFMSGGHYSPDGNRRVAAWLLTQLRARRSPHHSRIVPSLDLGEESSLSSSIRSG